MRHRRTPRGAFALQPQRLSVDFNLVAGPLMLFLRSEELVSQARGVSGDMGG